MDIAFVSHFRFLSYDFNGRDIGVEPTFIVPVRIPNFLRGFTKIIIANDSHPFLDSERSNLSSLNAYTS